MFELKIEYQNVEPKRICSLRRSLWFIVATLFIVATIVAGNQTIPKLRLLDSQQSCRNFRKPEGTVIFSANESSDPASHLSPSPIAAASPLPNCLIQISSLLGFSHYVANRQLLFLHERGPKDSQRIVLVMIGKTSNGENPFYGSLTAIVINPGTFLKQGTWHLASIQGIPNLRLMRDTGSSPAVLYFGESDPIDPSRFTIKYIVNGREGRIRGRLYPDDDVRFENDREEQYKNPS